MDIYTVSLLTALIFSAALLYSAVGHGGGSGYLAAMAFCAISPAIMKPTALTLNILVATIATIRYYRAGCFSWELFSWFALGAVPFAFLGGKMTLPDHTYKIIVGLVLLYAAFRLVFKPNTQNPAAILQPPSIPWMIGIGVLIGLLSGLTGVGGGIFLSPLILLMGWGSTRAVSGVSALFILVNSIAGLLGKISSLNDLPPALPYWMAAAAIGGWIGTTYGVKQLNINILQKILGVVLVIAGLKMMWI
jgi:uncharacterized membrane protein YfcA